MNLFIELVGNVMLATGISSGTFWFLRGRKKKKFVPLIDSSGIMRWAYDIKNEGFRCPKCRTVLLNKEQPSICDCVNYHKDHFHWKCVDCKFLTIMKTADDQ